MLSTLTRSTLLAVTASFAIIVAGCSTGDRNEADLGRESEAAAITASATLDQPVGPAELSCGGEVTFGPVPADLVNPNFTRYTELVMDGKTVMRFVIGDDLTDAQVERAVRLTRFYLQDVPGSRYGADKSAVRDTMARNNATMVMPNGAHGENDVGDLPPGQELYAAEIAAEGSSWYIDNDFDHRDAALEEIFHQIHDVGIGTTEPGALPDYQAELLARADATKGTTWGIGAPEWIAELAAEGSLAQEYIAAVIDSWYGQWGPWNGEGGMWDSYVAGTRTDVEEKDPEGAALLQAFLPNVLDYEAYIDPSFVGTFSLAFDEAQPYTHKSQYLRGARLTGDIDASLVGNDLDNTLRGNAGDNALDGGGGTDTAIYCNARSQYVITGNGAATTVTGPDGTDTLTNIEVIAFPDETVNL